MKYPDKYILYRQASFCLLCTLIIAHHLRIVHFFDKSFLFSILLFIKVRYTVDRPTSDELSRGCL